ncbi:MAG TPA: efflux RND transporter periplasmic adaptor subunit [Gemmatimonadales bacterium]
MRITRKYSLGFAACAVLVACGRAASEEELPGSAVTVWTDSTELFMEHPALVVGQPAKLAVHLTDLTDFAPLQSGQITLRFVPRDGGEPIVVTQDAPRIPGIFGPTAEFGRPGIYDLAIQVESPQARDSIAVPGLRVFANSAEVPTGEEEDGGIPFLKEQQWETPGFETAFARDGSVVESFDAAGEVVPAAGRAANVAAPIGGMIAVDGMGRSPAPGQWVQRGQLLVVLTPALGEAGSAYAQARRELREAEDEYARATRLYAVEAVPQRRVHEAEIRLQAAREALAGVGGGGAGAIDSTGRLPIRAPIGGVVASRRVIPGSRVAPGELLFSIVDPSVVWLEVHLPMVRAARLSLATGATFRLAGGERTYSARRTVSVGSVVDSLTRTLLVLYEVGNPDRSIKVGATATVSVGTGTRIRGVMVPSSAILDEDGRPVCYVQATGERFEKRELTLGANDGTNAVVLSGLRSGERVVTGAAYHVRLASLSTSVPAEGHAH